MAATGRTRKDGYRGRDCAIVHSQRWGTHLELPDATAPAAAEGLIPGASTCQNALRAGQACLQVAWCRLGAVGFVLDRFKNKSSSFAKLYNFVNQTLCNRATSQTILG